MSTVILDTITGKSTATTITIGSTPVVSASANSMTIRGEGSAQTSIQQGLCKVWADVDMTGTATLDDSFNASGLTDHGTGSFTITHNSDMGNGNYVYTAGFNNEVSDASAYIKIHSPSDKLAASAKFLKKENGSAADCAGNYIAIHGDLA